MSAIGGYFGLELKKQKEYHGNAISLNTGRSAFEYILRANLYTKIYIPYYTCDVLLQPLRKLNIAYEYYNIDQFFEPIFNFEKVGITEAFLYTNYFGLKDQFISTIKGLCTNLIIDNAQAFFSTPLEGINTFYSPRKYFGVPDGGYLYSNMLLNEVFEQDNSYNRCEHLLRRIDVSANDGYSFYIQNESLLDDVPVLLMSNLTKSILQSIDYYEIAFRRRENFRFLHQELKGINLLNFTLQNNQVPMVYPFLSNIEDLRKILFENNIYTAIYWPNILNYVEYDSIEFKYAQNLVHLPIDQRYSESDLVKLIQIIKL